MPISLEEFRKPKWIRYKTRYTLSDNEKDRYREIVDGESPRRYRGPGNTFLQAGYNPNHNSTRVEKIKLDKESFTLKGY